VPRSLAEAAPAASSRVEPRPTLTVDTSHGSAPVRNLEDGAAQALRVMGAANPAAAAPEVIGRAAAPDLLHIVRTASDAPARTLPPEEWDAAGLTWRDAGPNG